MRAAVVVLVLSLAACAARARQLEAAAQPAIVGGTEAPRNRYPYVAQLRLDNASKSLKCGGTLIAERFVLTAAHCVVNSTDGQRYPAAQFRPLVRVGAYLLDPTSKNDTYEQRKVIATAVHSSYVYFNRIDPKKDPLWVTEWNNDLALLMLDSPITNKAIPRLPAFTRKPNLAVSTDGGTVTPVGWGVRNARTKGAPTYADMSPVLKQVTLPFLPLDTCAREFNGVAQREAAFEDPTNTMVCAGLIDLPNVLYEENTCYGDSGGPAVARSSAAPSDPSKDLVVGVTSWGAREYDFGGGAIQNCQGAPSVFTNVAQLRPWIEDTMRRLLGGSWASSLVGRAGAQPSLRRFPASSALPAVTQTVAAVAGRSVDLLSCSSYSLVGIYNRPDLRTTALGLASFQWGSRRVSVQLSGTSARVFVDGVRLLPGRAAALGTTGNVTYLAPARATTEVTIAIPGVQIKVQQPFVAASLRYSPWLNVAVSLSQVPPLPVTGVMGATFPAASLGKDEWVR